MSNYLVTTFSAGSTTALTSFTNDDSSTWAGWGSANSGGAPNVFSSLGGICAPGNQGLKCYRSSTISGTQDTTITGAWYFGTFTNFSFVGICVALNSGETKGYLVGYSLTNTRWEIYAITSGALATTLLANSSSVSYSANDTPGFEIIKSGTGASTQIELKISGSTVCTATDSSQLGNATAAGYAGVFFNTVGASNPDSGLFIGSITADDSTSAFSATFTTPKAGQVCQLSSGATGTATIGASGTYTGAVPDQVRLVQDGTSTAVSGHDWATISSASGGTWSHSFASVPKGSGWYNVQIRNQADGTIATSGKVGAGVLVGVEGQSQAWLWFSATAYAGDSSLTADSLLRITGIQPSNAWSVPNTATMNAAIACGNDLVASLSCPVALVDGAWDGSGLTVTGNGGQWISGGAAGNAYTASASAVSTAGNKLAAQVWIQGETDCASTVSQSDYYTALGQMIALRRTDVSNASLPYIIATLARDTTTTQTDTQRENVKLAQVQKCGDSNVYRVDRMDLPLHTDGIHHTAAGFTALGKRCARAILHALGVVSGYRGPSYSTVTQVNSTTYDVNLTFGLGADVTPTTGITGFRVTDGGTPATISSVSHTAGTSTIRIVLASAPAAAPVVQYLYGTAPTITGVVKDDSSLTLPLEFNGGVTASVTVAGTVASATASGLSASIALRTNIGASVAAASASGLAASLALHTAIAAAVGTGTASGLAAALALHTTISASVGAASASGLSATINVGSGVTIGAAVGEAVASGLSAGVAAHVVVAAGVGSATASGLAAGVTLGGTGTGATAAEIWGYVLADGRTAAETLLDNARMMRIILAGIAGKTAGLGTDTETYFGEDETTPRIVASFDSQGNRVSVATDGAP